MERDVVYASVGGRELALDLYLPAETPEPYLIVWVHGGAWHSGSKADPPLDLVASGYALASVGYRLSPEAPFPAMIHDLKAAIRFLRARAGDYGYWAEKIAIWGASAGGHLAALVGTTNGHPALEGDLGAYRDHSSAVQAIVDFYGPTNFLSILEQSTPHGLSVRAPALALLLGRPVEQVEELAKLASPVYHVDPSDPPLLILHGDRDVQVPINQSHELQGAYEAAGLRADLVVVHGAGHTDPVYYTPAYLRLVDAFLSEALGQP